MKSRRTQISPCIGPSSDLVKIFQTSSLSCRRLSIALEPKMMKDSFCLGSHAFCFIEKSCYMNRQVFWSRTYLLDHQDHLLTPFIQTPSHMTEFACTIRLFTLQFQILPSHIAPTTYIAFNQVTGALCICEFFLM